jgi:prohibitin 1
MSFYDEEELVREKGKMVKSMLAGTVGIGIALLVLGVVGWNCIYKINPGYSGVVYNMDGGIEENVISQGYTAVLPWKKVIEYPISTETVYYTKGSDDKQHSDNSINVNTKDGKQVNVDVTYTYHMDPAQLPHIFTKFRGQPAEMIEASIMKNEMYQAVNNVTSQYSLMELVGDKRPEVNAKIMNAFSEALRDDGIMIETFNLSDVRPDEATQQAIQNVVNAQNALAQSRVEKEKAEIEAEQARITAKGKADAAVIQAEGQARANEKIQQTLTPMVIQQRQIEKWNGELPKYMLGDASNILLNVNQ